jgi:hypothetical protein
MPSRHPTFKNHRNVKKSSGKKFGTFFAVRVIPPWGLMGVKIYLSKIFWDLRHDGAIKNALAPAVATPVKSPKKE